MAWPERAERRSARVAAGAAVFLMVLVAGCTVEIPLTPSYGELREVTVQPSGRWLEFNELALIDIDGFIGSTAGIWSMGGTSVADVKEKLKRAEENDAVKGVLLRIDSPGGEVTASDLIYREVRAFRRRSGKPVVAYLMGLATSGGYYVALAADRVVAGPTTITGSVGVIMDFIDVELLMKTLGVRRETVKSGEMKDMGSPFRGMNEAEREVFEGVNRAMFERFLTLVRQRRKLSPEATARIADGRILVGRQALDLGLVDALGDLDDALDDLKRLAGIRDADVIAYRPHKHYNRNVYARFGGRTSAPRALPDLLRALGQRTAPRLLYLWTPQR